MPVWQTEHVPHALQEAIVKAAASVYWYRKPLLRLLRKNGAPGALLDELSGSDASKIEIVEAVLDALDKRGLDGARVQHQIAAALVSIAPDPAQVNVATAKAAQRALRAVAEEHGILRMPGGTPREAPRSVGRDQAMAARRKEVERRAKLAELQREFCTLAASDADKQGRGYRLERMLGEVAQLEGLRWTPPFRNSTVSQTDGMLELGALRYLIEARWRVDTADANELGAFADKVYRAMQSTRGVFLSMAGFRPEVVQEIDRGHRNVVCVSGHEFMLVLDDRITLKELLERKIDDYSKGRSCFFDVALELAA